LLAFGLESSFGGYTNESVRGGALSDDPRSRCIGGGTAVTSMTEMPRSVAWFERLMYLGVIIGIAGLLLHPTAPTKRILAEDGVVGLVASSTLAVGLYALAIWSIARRRKNWVRWGLLIALVLSLPWVVKHLVLDYQGDPVTVIKDAAQLLIHGLAFCFVFSADARPWFQKPKSIDPDIFS
jgi:hypothetical protein